jgi:predicted small metal-binding protein
MKFALSCGDAVPGCSARFEEDSRERILELVTVHAMEDHGVPEVTPEMLEAIGNNIVVLSDAPSAV